MLKGRHTLEFGNVASLCFALTPVLYTLKTTLGRVIVSAGTGWNTNGDSYTFVVVMHGLKSLRTKECRRPPLLWAIVPVH